MSALQDVIDELKGYYGIELSERDIRAWKRILSKYIKPECKDCIKPECKDCIEPDTPTYAGIASFICITYIVCSVYWIFSKNISILQPPLFD